MQHYIPGSKAIYNLHDKKRHLCSWQTAIYGGFHLQISAQLNTQTGFLAWEGHS